MLKLNKIEKLEKYRLECISDARLSLQFANRGIGIHSSVELINRNGGRSVYEFNNRLVALRRKEEDTIFVTKA